MPSSWTGIKVGATPPVSTCAWTSAWMTGPKRCQERVRSPMIDDLLGVQAGDDHAHAAAQKVRHGLEGLGGAGIALVGEPQQVLES